MSQILISDCFVKQSELQSPPIMDSEAVSKYLHVRVTASWFTLEQLDAFLTKHLEQYIISVEKIHTPEQHYHMMINWSGKKRETFSPFIKTFDPRIKGNKHLSVEWQRNDRNPSYVLKEGNYISKGFEQKQIDDWFKVSFLKYSGNDFREALTKIEDAYLTTSCTLAQFIQNYIQLKVRYKQSINHNTIKSFATMLYYKKNPRAIFLDAKRLAQQIEYDFRSDRIDDFSYNSVFED